MLKPLFGVLPTDKRIAGIHSIPVTDEGSIVMVWDKYEKNLTTVGGRLESGEKLDEALDRETVEEAGLLLEAERVPIAAWYWENTDTYTVFVIAKVKQYVEMPDGFETTGRVTMNIETAQQLVYKLEGEGLRTELLGIVELELRSEWQ
ncbi:NUDIX domain-containing protein [Paenibacillus lupini]|uniref:NUDIX domain-containing protein n=1 Tax=Paenibacillus lupini TaxID=1450204 RepID=UPI00141DF286|nr:NUDIX domain-containing protein [Paenibacillus lupini]NIK21381.1 ADP-ribose pyrophosphatase YjhB (NUDIX family) [Paenibacillus lupini]